MHIVNWETFGKRACVVNVSGRCSLGFLDILSKLTGVTHQRSVTGSRVTLPDHFAYKHGLSLTVLVRTLVACKQGLRKLQISVSVNLINVALVQSTVGKKMAAVHYTTLLYGYNSTRALIGCRAGIMKFFLHSAALLSCE